MDDQAVTRTYGNTNLPEGTPDRPLVTFALFAYNQAKYIPEAVEGAFSQTYSPLEIILSDDCSSDRTFEIMEEMARAYQGPHVVKVRRGSVNLNIGAHVSSVFDIVGGDIIVVAAGDDISAPERTSVIVAAALLNPDAMAFCSAYRILGSDVVCPADPPETLTALLSRKKWLHGATAAYRLQLHQAFPRMKANVRNEDEVYALRALLLGKLISVSRRPLVSYRTTVGVSAENFRPYDPRVFKKASLVELKYRTNLIRQWSRDLVQAGQGAARSSMYEFRLSNAYQIGLATRRRSWRLFTIYRRTFGTKAAAFQYLGHRFPRMLNAYLRVRYHTHRSGSA